ncbi:CheR family methyltransferase [Coleofasciculus sp. E1-EBD-02]|uniref:CheR family methyltransferase n=1 Tax=Coleofasciculus sp. E1-EBD-02 TaxID=3068481 RepID=UPI0040631CF9
METLLEYLKYSHGCDLTGYKRPSLERRFLVRMRELKIDSYLDYLHYLQSHSQESIHLLNTVLINLTSFFRDRASWEYLANELIPTIIASKQPDEPIRVWSAACASGQEVYSVVILFAEALGIESCLQRLQFIATDWDKDALSQARNATYKPKDVSEIPADLLEKYFEQTEQGYIFHRQLRRRIIFADHNLVKHAPMSKIDLLVCRNALMYFKSDIQITILIRFHFGLKNNGFLFLGKAEMVMTPRSIFTPINIKHRVYQKGLKLELEEHLQLCPRSRKKPAIDSPATDSRIWQTAFETSPVAQLAIDSNRCLILANAKANTLFGLTLNDLGSSLQSLQLGQLPGLCQSFEKVNRDRNPATLENVGWKTANDTTYFNISITPVFNADTQLICLTEVSPPPNKCTTKEGLVTNGK